MTDAPSAQACDEVTPGAASADAASMSIAATDPIELSELVGDWNFRFSQLEPGALQATAAVIGLEGAALARLALNRTMLQSGYAPKNMVAVFIPTAESRVFANGQLMEPGQAVTLAEGGQIEALSHGAYSDLSLGIDMRACRAQLELLNGGPLEMALGTAITAPGPAWTEDMFARSKWLLSVAVDQPQSFQNVNVRASLTDHLLAAMARFDDSPADVDATTRGARTARRVAVRVAREFIHARLSEPLRLSELCRQAQLKIRSLEYGFREVTGLTPIAYVRSLRLNAVSRALHEARSVHQRSISDIAMDAGFWHLGQFAVDYRRLFGETPTATRRRTLQKAPSRRLPQAGRQASSHAIF